MAIIKLINVQSESTNLSIHDGNVHPPLFVQLLLKPLLNIH